jgi:ribose transport system permease protein
MPLVKAKVIVADMAGGETFGIPIPFFIFLVIAVLSAVFLGMTVWGRYMMALGRSKEAADYSGINTDRMTILAYILSAVLAAFGGMLFALDSNSVSPSSFGNSFELFAIAAAVLGGCSLHGGEGGIFGVAVGTVLMQVLKNLILFLSIPDTLEQAIIGGVILIGVVVDEVFRAVSRRRK